MCFRKYALVWNRLGKPLPISLHPSISCKLAALGRVAMEWFWEAYMREASATSFAVLPEKYCQKE